ncbi:uncharacterized protein BJ212DRAFT_1486822 [Suillus subaureus]|uniref:Uncharacterized protein n=1 Tax=Suillus subaureus TaxID=48587 RepID=A0A9P7DVG4_9AGAM|nr:uncharacterized protein BJ212DRAFT_1486822 [Suillus subaureus]KAG1804183.1 hypothetical protein BJ212DRAFT_1486822 [Suillus subaureus]
MGQSSECLDNAESAGSRVYFDGIKTQMPDKVPVSMQHTICDGHHNQGDILMKYAKASIPPGETLTETNNQGNLYERGQNTFMKTMKQGHDPEMHGIHLSKDMVSGPHGTPYIYAYFQVTEVLALYFAEMFCMAFPEFYEEYRKTVEAGK